MIVSVRGQQAYIAESNGALADLGDVEQAIDINAIDPNECYLWKGSHVVHTVMLDA